MALLFCSSQLLFDSCGGRPVQVKRLRGSRSVSVPVLFSRNFEFASACLQKFFWSEISAENLEKKRGNGGGKKKPFVLLIIESKDEKEKRRREEREEREKNERGKER